MGLPGRFALNLVQKLGVWSSTSFIVKYFMSLPEGGCACAAGQTHRCRNCWRFFCGNCMQTAGAGMVQPKFCKNCYNVISGYLDEERVRSPVLLSSLSDSKLARLSESPRPLRCSTRRNCEDDDLEGMGRHYYSPMSAVSQEYCNSDIEFYSCKSSPFDSPSIGREDHSPVSDQESPGCSRRFGSDEEMMESSSECAYGNVAVSQNDESRIDESQNTQPQLDFANNTFIWSPPPAVNEDDDVETFFLDDYDEDDGYVSDSTTSLPSSRFSSDGLFFKEKPTHANKEQLRNTLREHFTILVAQLLKGEGLQTGSEDGGTGWLEVVSSLAWQAANFVKPDTSKGGSMDPGHYVKVKCISSGSPSDSMLIKGVVCTKNVKHKHMISQHKNPRLLILGGALGVPNTLASLKSVHEQETEHLRMAVSKIESHRPNVLLVERTVSSYVQEYLLAKEISLVSNVKRKLLERISRCTGAQIASSVDNLASVRTGQCEMFRVAKVLEECLSSTAPNKKSVKTLMFFEGCPRRLGCTVLLKGACLEELKKVKGVIQYASFAAYHLSLETSFLADEGATLPTAPLKPPKDILEKAKTCIPPSSAALPNLLQENSDENNAVAPCDELGMMSSPLYSSLEEKILRKVSPDEECPSACEDIISGDVYLVSLPDSRDGDYIGRSTKPEASMQYQTGAKIYESKMLKNSLTDHIGCRASGELNASELTNTGDVPSTYFSTADNHESILVSLSSSCILKGTVCEPSRLFRIKFYGSSDKPLGKFLRNDLFDQSSFCRACQEPAEAHVRCYIHQQGSLTISVKKLPSTKLSGERDGRIWMWHRCLKCDREDGVPPAAHRVVMSDAAWGLSFGKFLELSFSNHSTANRVASCGHSLQRDCLRFYGLGSMVAFFRYSPVDILSMDLPPLVLDFFCDVQSEWVTNEAAAVSSKLEYLHGEVGNMLFDIEQRITTSEHDPLNTSLHKHISDLRDQLKKETYEYYVLLHSVDNTRPSSTSLDILELNRLGHSLLIDSYTWDRRLHLLHSICKGEKSSFIVDPQPPDVVTHTRLKELRDDTFQNNETFESLPEKTGVKLSTLSTLSRSSRNSTLTKQHVETSLHVLECNSNNLVEMDMSIESVDGFVGPAGLNLVSGQSCKWDEKQIGTEDYNDTLYFEGITSTENNLSDKIDLLWTGSGLTLSSATSKASLFENPHYRKLKSPARVHSFDSAMRYQNKVSGLSASSQHFSKLKSFDALVNLVNDPIENMSQAHTQGSLRPSRSLNFRRKQTPSAFSMVSEGARLLLSRPGLGNIVISVYDDDPGSIISYFISSQEHANFIVSNFGQYEGFGENEKNSNVDKHMGYCDGPSSVTLLKSGSHFHDDIQSGSNESQQLRGNVNTDPKESHFRFSFEDDTDRMDKVKFTVKCYFAKQFDALRKKCCPNEVDFIRSLSRCKNWNAQGGKSNVYFAKSWDERFIIKEVTKTELYSFEKFAPKYFTYLTESINNGSPTCLAKVLGIYQVNTKHLKGGRETKMDLIVMENLFFQRNISTVYDLKGSVRSRYNPDTSVNKVLLDLNLLETLRTKPIFLGSKANRKFERAVWNDTSFLASIHVMDYSLLVGIDEEKNVLVVGIIDFMRQYTWDKKLETWVKASGILGGPKNASPTVVSPEQYKKRFRKAMSSYFLTFPDQWCS